MCVRLLHCKTKTKDGYLENRKHKAQSVLTAAILHWVNSCTNSFFSINFFLIEDKNDHITVCDGDVSAFVVLGQRHGGSLRRGHNPNCAAAVGALQMGLMSQLGRLDAQTL